MRTGKEKKLLDESVLGRAAARYSDLVYLLSQRKDLLEEDVAHTYSLAVDQGDWKENSTANWNSTAIAVAKRPSEKMIFVGEEGQVITYVGGAETEETLTPEPAQIRRANTIDGIVYACGMHRQVYKRVGEGCWIDMSAPTPGDDDKTGFEAIDGFSGNEVYVVGWSGEIWQFDGSIWHNRGSLTNLILTAVCCADDGMVYIIGQQGVVIKGRNDTWEIVELERQVTLDLWDLCWFKDKLYVATMAQLYTLDANSLVPVDLGEAEATSFYSLTQAEGVMWSIGSKDVLSFDGNTWASYT